MKKERSLQKCSSLGKSILMLLFLFLLCITLLESSYAFAQDKESPKKTKNGVVPGRYIVVLNDYIQDPESVAQRIARFHRLELGHVYKRVLKGFSARIPENVLNTVKDDPDIAYVEPDRLVYAVSQTVPTGVDRIDAEFYGSPLVDADIAIIDTGIDLDHSDLNVVNSINCANWGSSCSNGGDDGNGHGTHVAGIAAALDNDIGVVGVAPGARLWSVRVLNNNGTGYLSWIIKGIDWVTMHAHEIEVANTSLSWSGYSAAARTAIQNSVESGVVYFAAAGNDGKDIFGSDGNFGTGDDICPASPYARRRILSEPVPVYRGNPGRIDRRSTSGRYDYGKYVQPCSGIGRRD